MQNVFDSKIMIGRGEEKNRRKWMEGERTWSDEASSPRSLLSLLIQMIQTQRYARSSTILTSGVCRRQLLFRRNKLPRIAAAAALCHVLSTRSMTDILMPCRPPSSSRREFFSFLAASHLLFIPPIRCVTLKQSVEIER